MTQYLTSCNLPALVCASLSLLTALIVALIYRRRIAMVTKAVARQSSEAAETAEKLPAASIIVYTYNNPEGLAKLLPQLITQDYPGDFEIIVVNDSRDDASEMLVGSLSSGAAHRLYHTFTPRDTRNVSRKKLALTLGLKAAKNDLIVHVTSDTRINSPHWLRELLSPMSCEETEIVIGYASPDITADTGYGSRARYHDRLMGSVEYLSSALCGKAYRGDGDNLAYRRDTFFRMNGFIDSINLHYGDDDVFIYKAATRKNVAVAIGNDAQVTSSVQQPVNDYNARKLRYTFTSRLAGRGQHFFYGFGSFLLWLWVALTASAIILSPADIVIAGTCVISALVMWLPLMIAWKRVSTALHTRRFNWSVPGFMLWRPIRNIRYRLLSRKIHDAQYAWHNQSMA